MVRAPARRGDAIPVNASWNYPTLMCMPPGNAGGVLPTENVLPLEAGNSRG